MNLKKHLKINDANRGAYKDTLDDLENAYDTSVRNMVQAIYNCVMAKGEIVIPHYASLYFDEKAASSAPTRDSQAGYVTVDYIGNKGTHWLNEHKPSEIFDLVARIFNF